MALLDKVKLAIPITSSRFDDDLTDLISAARLDLQRTAGVQLMYEDELVNRAIITYCKLHFGEPKDAARLQESYDMQKAQLQSAREYH